MCTLESARRARIREHYAAHWGKATAAVSRRGAMLARDPAFVIEVRAPTAQRDVWIYSTVGMSCDPERGRIETHLLSRVSAEDASVLLLSMLAYFHLTGEPLGLEHTVYVGQPWLPGSRLDHGYLSLPYLDGPDLEWQRDPEGDVRHLWLIPITREERELKRAKGAEALERLFEEAPFAYDDPFRAGVV
jgi:hypothetical protein